MSSPNKSTSFFRLLNSLPQELHDEIIALAWPLICSMKPPKLITINKDYKPPSQLQINRQIRTTLACIYYSNTTFIGHYDDVKKWIISLSPTHKTMAMKIRCWIDTEDQEDLEERNRELVMELGFVGWYNRSLRVYGAE